ncbi:PLAT/LH2 domain protein [bacterium BMS3Abin04]|nr:PLAT/LH2 domain protein [bacterium BMS3Abin04]
MKYKITFQTSNKSGAGTDANIYLKLNGSIRSSETIHLNKYFDKTDFEAGTTSNTTLELSELGDITKLEIRQDTKSFAFDWVNDFF